MKEKSYNSETLKEKISFMVVLSKKQNLKHKCLIYNISKLVHRYINLFFPLCELIRWLVISREKHNKTDLIFTIQRQQNIKLIKLKIKIIIYYKIRFTKEVPIKCWD